MNEYLRTKFIQLYFNFFYNLLYTFYHHKFIKNLFINITGKQLNFINLLFLSLSSVLGFSLEHSVIYLPTLCSLLIVFDGCQLHSTLSSHSGNLPYPFLRSHILQSIFLSSLPQLSNFANSSFY